MPRLIAWSYWLGLLLLLILVAALVWLNRRLLLAQARIQEEKAARDRLVAELPVGLYELLDDPSGGLRFAFLSDRAVELLGVGREELEADFFAAFRRFHPEDLKRVSSLNAQARRTGSAFQANARILAGGQTRWINIQSRPRADGVNRRWAGIVSDITDRVSAQQALAENERLLANMSRLSNTGGWQLDLASGQVRWTEQTFAIHELPKLPISAEPLLEQALSFYDGEDRSRLQQAIERASTQGEGYDLTLRMTTAAGRERITRSLCQPIVENGQVVRLIGAFQDITDLVQQQRRAEEAEQRFRSMLEQAPIGILLLDAETGEMLDANAEACCLFGAETVAALLAAQQNLWDVSPHDQVQALQLVRQAGKHGHQQFDWRSRRIDGRTMWLQVTLTVVRIDGTDFVLAACIDITLRLESQRLLRESDERFRSLLMDVPEVAVQGYRLDGRVSYWNRASERLYGYTEAEALGASLLDLIIPPEDREAVCAALKRVAEGGRIDNSELELVRKDGSRVTVFSNHTVLHLDGRPTELFCLDIDLSERKQYELELARIANYDTLTGLPNRQLLAELMREHCARADRGKARDNERLAVCFLDLDEFKPINDRYGHDIGDQVLIEVARRLRVLLRGADTVARLGGDEFVLLLAGFTDEAGMARRLRQILDRIADPITVQALNLRVSGSLGVTLYPDDAVDPDTLLRHADQAMYRAKLQGRNRYSLFDPLMEEGLHQRHARLLEIQAALDEAAFELYYQPKIDLRSGIALGMEGLVRWNHPVRGLLAPAGFLGDLAHSDMEAGFGIYVVERALEQLAAWLDQGLVMPISVNISGAHLLTPGFAEQLKVLLQRFPQLPAGLLQLEILETAAVTDLKRAISVVDEVHRMGVQVSLDDFGTGYSSLSHLRSLPVDEVKIDRAFVVDMLVDLNDYSIVRSVIGLAGSFGLRVVAEGVETLAHASALIDLGCDYAQGYAFAPPMPAGQIPAWLEQWQGQAAELDWAEAHLNEQLSRLAMATTDRPAAGA